MAASFNATVSGGTGAFVLFIPDTSAGNTSLAQKIATTINTQLLGSVGEVGINSAGATGSLPTTPAVGLIGGYSPTSLGPLNLGTLTPNIISLLINNTDSTTVANTQYNSNEKVVGGMGGLNFTDNGQNTTIDVGGGVNSVTFTGTSANGFFAGDGTNTLTVNSSSGVTTVVGTGSSADTITGSGSLDYVGATGSTAFINPTTGNVTVYGGGGGAQTVFGGTQYISNGKGGGTFYTAPAFTGTLTVVQGTGYFQGGTAGGNNLSASSAGATTLVGGGNADTLTAGGVGDVLVAPASGSSTLNGALSAGGDTFWAGANGATSFYGSQSIGDTFYMASSTVAGTGFVGQFISLHTAPNSGTTLYNLNTNVSNTVVIDLSETGNANNVTIGDFIAGVDVLKIGNAQGALTFKTLAAGQVYQGVQITTAAGSTINLYNSNSTDTTSNGPVTQTNITRF